ncbi:hypothetical protein RB195_024225 [Necator americanus]|uniref:Uncharacterized protein n=1 Tax=Necator americanus TaxID=51031 RepID=A0ABR1EN75_NECAM
MTLEKNCSQQHVTFEKLGNLVESVSSSTRVWQKISTLLTNYDSNRTFADKNMWSALTIFVAYASKLNYEEMETFYMNPEKFYRDDYTFYKASLGNFNAKIGLRKTLEKLHIANDGLQWNEQVERLSEFIMASRGIRGNSQF